MYPPGIFSRSAWGRRREPGRPAKIALALGLLVLGAGFVLFGIVVLAP